MFARSESDRRSHNSGFLLRTDEFHICFGRDIPDYETLAYYDVGHFGYVRKDETVVSEFYGENYETEVYYSDFFPYDPDADMPLRCIQAS